MHSPPPNTIPGNEVASSQASELARRAQRQRWNKVLSEIDVHDRAQAEGSSAEAQIALLKKQQQDAQGQARGLQEILRQREHKIGRMQSSFSWKITAPLRALRRTFLKASAKQAPEPPAPGAASAADPRFLWSVDQPSRWDEALCTGQIKGWFLWMPEARPAVSIRARFGNDSVDARMGLPRPDVVVAHGFDRKLALGCGFSLEYSLDLGTECAVCIEALADDGRWIPFARQHLSASKDPSSLRGYEEWIKAYDTRTPERTATLRTRLEGLAGDRRPLFSVLMPVFNSPAACLQRAIESVCAQLYGNWELCIADDASTEPHVRPLLEAAAAREPRIRLCLRNENGHISRASNSALDLARGDFVALLDHDDELAPNALAECALLLAEHPDTDIIYSDEDKLDEQGKRFQPYFKSDYLPDLELGQHYLLHLAVYRADLVKKVGGFREGLEGSQDWDLTLRCLEQSHPGRIRHIPKVLYHWRAIAGSTSLLIGEKHYAVTAAERALREHFSRRNLKAALLPTQGSHWQVLRALPEKLPLVSIIIPTHNGAALLRRCIASIFARSTYGNFEILVVNNRSDEPEALALLKELGTEDRIRVFDYPREFNYSAINNTAASQARGEVLCLLNNDIEVISPHWIEEMLSHALQPEIGAVGAMLYYPNDTIQHAGVILGLGGVAHHAFVQLPRGSEGYMNRARLAQNYSAVTGACMLMRREVYEKVGGLNEKELAIAFNDIDLCLRILKAGYRNLWTPFAELYHHESATRGFEDTPEKQKRFQREAEYMRAAWGPILDRDPAYNPNLTLGAEGWDLAWPPRT